MHGQIGHRDPRDVDLAAPGRPRAGGRAGRASRSSAARSERSQSRAPSSSGLAAARERQLGAARDARVQALRDVAGARLELVLEQVGARRPCTTGARAPSSVRSSPSSIHAISRRGPPRAAPRAARTRRTAARRGFPGRRATAQARLGIGALLGGRRRHDDDRDVRVARALVADGAEHEPDEAAVPARADDQQVGVRRLVEQHLRAAALDRLGAHVHARSRRRRPARAPSRRCARRSSARPRTRPRRRRRWACTRARGRPRGPASRRARRAARRRAGRPRAPPRRPRRRRSSSRRFPTTMRPIAALQSSCQRAHHRAPRSRAGQDLPGRAAP